MIRNELKKPNCLKSIILFSLICCAHINVSGQHLSLSNYNNETEIKAAKSITLTDGFYIPSGKTVRIFTDASLKQIVNQVGQPSSNQNYISTKVFKESNVTKENINDQRNVYEVSQTVQYFDGLGRPLQTVQVQGSPDFKDIVVPVAYDAFGRGNKKYLPYVASAGINGTYRVDALTAQ